MDALEARLEDIFSKQLPPLPSSSKKWLVNYLPWLSILLGIFSLYAAFLLWQWAHVANNLVNYANSFSAIYSGPITNVHHLTLAIWLGLICLVAEALLYLAAYAGLKTRRKSGWQLIYYALLINLFYGLVMAFTSYGGFFSLVEALLGSAIGFYFIFQIKSFYKKSHRSSSAV